MAFTFIASSEISWFLSLTSLLCFILDIIIMPQHFVDSLLSSVLMLDDLIVRKIPAIPIASVVLLVVDLHMSKEALQLLGLPFYLVYL